MSIIENFRENLKPTYYEELRDVNYILLEEKKGEKYIVEFNIATKPNHFLIIKDLEDLKMQEAKYLINKPQDCDYIILDILKKIVYFVELKDTKITNAGFVEQLVAGERWLSHLLFCCRCEGEDFILENEDWCIKRIGVRYEKARPSRSVRSQRANGSYKRLENVSGKELFVFKGKYFHLEKVRFDH